MNRVKGGEKIENGWNIKQLVNHLKLIESSQNEWLISTKKKSHEND